MSNEAMSGLFGPDEAEDKVASADVASGGLWMTNPMGEVVKVSSEEYGAAVASGYRSADSHQVGEATIQNQMLNDEEAKRNAFLGGALSGATIGMSDIVLSQAGHSSALRRHQEYLPGQRSAGEGVGTLAGAAASFGGGAAARGVSAPIRMLQAPGKFLTQGMRPGMAKMALQGAVDGGVMGTSMQLGQQNISGNYDPEQLMQAAMHGGLMGGGLGALLGGPMAIMNKAAAGRQAAMAARAERGIVAGGGVADEATIAAALQRADDGMAARGFDLYAQGTERVVGVDAGEIAKLNPFKTEGRAAYKSLQAAQNDARIYASGNAKRINGIAGNIEAAESELVGNIKKLKSEQADIRAKLAKQKGKKFVGDDGLNVAEAEGKIQAIMEREAVLEAKLTRFKDASRKFGKYWVGSKGRVKGSNVSNKKFQDVITSKSGRKGIRHANSEPLEAMRDMAKSYDELIKDLGNDAYGKDLGALAEMATNVEEIGGRLEALDNFNDFIRKPTREGALGSSRLGAMLGAGAWAMSGGGAGAVAHGVVNAFSMPEMALQYSHRLGNYLAKNASKADRGVGKLSKLSKKVTTATSKMGERPPRQATVLTSYARARRDKGDRSIKSQYARVESTYGHEDRMHSEIADQLGASGYTADDIANAAAISVRGRDYAMSMAPMHANGMKPSDQEVYMFRQTLQGINDPYSVIIAAGAGELTIGRARAVEKVYPKMFNDMRKGVQGEVARLRSLGRRLPPHTRINLSTAFRTDFDGRITEQYRMEMQAGEMTERGNPQQESNGVPEIASTYATGSEKVGEK